MARPPSRLGRNTRRALLDKGLELFAEKGFFGTGLRDLARAVGVRESTLYYHFPGKEALFEAILEEDDSDHQAAIRLIEQPIRSAGVFLRVIARRVLAHFATLRQRRLHRILMSDGFRLATSGQVNLLERMGGRVALFTRAMERLVAARLLRADRSPDLLGIEFAAPLLVWRQLKDVHPGHPAVVAPEAFIKLHVEQFLMGAARVSRTRPAPRTRSRA